MSEEEKNGEIDQTYRGYVSNRILTTARPLSGDEFLKKLAKIGLSYDEAVGGELEYLDMKVEELSPGRVLDVGIGGGRSLLQALQLGIDIYAIDLALRARVGGTHPGATTQAREQIALENLQAVKDEYPQRFVEADATQRIPFADDYFKTVIACMSLPHYARNSREAVTSILEMIRVARGRVVFTSPYPAIPEHDLLAEIGIGRNRFNFRLAGFLHALEAYGINFSWKQVPNKSAYNNGNIVSAHLDVSKKDQERLNSERQLLLDSADTYQELR